MAEARIAIVTGANRGIGKEIAKELAGQGVRVIVTARDDAKGKAVADDLHSINSEVLFHPLDITSGESIAALVKFVEVNFNHLDILVNNAALGGGGDSIQTSLEDFKRIFDTNFYGAFNLSRALIALLKKSSSGRIINVSSGMGALNGMSGGHAAYRISKTALNSMTAVMASDLSNTKIRVNTMCPGWVKTDMGGAGASRSVEKGAETAVWLALEPGIPTGKFFRDKKIIDW